MEISPGAAGAFLILHKYPLTIARIWGIIFFKISYYKSGEGEKYARTNLQRAGGWCKPVCGLGRIRPGASGVKLRSSF
jgi:hypothetical protein